MVKESFVIEKANITGIILCGGRGARLSGLDKPLIDLGSKRIVDCMIERLSDQVCDLILSCSRNVALYEALGYRVVVDGEPSEGPLAGLHESFSRVETEWVLTTPGDVPFIPRSLVDRLTEDALSRGVSVPSIQGQQQNLCMILGTQERESLSEFYIKGGRAVKEWLQQHIIPSTDLSDIAQDFLNVNTMYELNEARSRFALENKSAV
ncbi:MAG: NTP transferase domain-containing protein [Gammaproteobacteria bacterium]|nr:NTP transferase domain-containing protein [Gammaproteobacteria bacterium]